MYVYISLILFACNENNQDDMIIDDLKLNQIQVVGSHNSYRINTTTDMHNLIASFQPDLAHDLDYGHPTLEVQFSQYEFARLKLMYTMIPKADYFITSVEIFLLECQLHQELKNY